MPELKSAGSPPLAQPPLGTEAVQTVMSLSPFFPSESICLLADRVQINEIMSLETEVVWHGGGGGEAMEASPRCPFCGAEPIAGTPAGSPVNAPKIVSSFLLGS